MGNFTLKRENLSEQDYQPFLTVYSKYQISFIFQGYLPKIYCSENQRDLAHCKYLQVNINFESPKTFKNLFFHAMVIGNIF